MNSELIAFVRNHFLKSGAALDLGMGSGQDVEGLKQMGWQARGIDKSDFDLNNLYQGQKAFDLIYSNYLLHFLTYPDILFQTCNLNLKKGGWLFIQTFDKTDPIIKGKGFTSDGLEKLLKESGKYQEVTIQKLRVFDNEKQHQHWHQVLKLSAQKV